MSFALFERVKSFRKKSKTYQLFLLTVISQKLLLEKLRDLWDAMPCHWSLCFLLSPCYLQDTMPSQGSSSDLPRVLRI